MRGIWDIYAIYATLIGYIGHSYICQILTYVLCGVRQLVVVADSDFALGTDSEDVVGARLQILNTDFFT